MLLVNGSSLIPEGSGRDVWLYMSDLATPLDLAVMLDLTTDVSIGGSVVGDLALETSQALGPLHLRARIRDGNLATVEAYLSNVPRTAELSFQYTQNIILDLELSEGIRLAHVKLTRDLGSAEAPATWVTLHDVPTLVNVSVVSGGSKFDMDAPDILANLPDVLATTNEPGLDLLVSMEGRSLGNKVDLFLDARNVDDMSMTLSDDEYRISAGRLDFFMASVSGVHYSKGTWIDRLDMAGTDLTRVAVKVHMVFGVFPLIQVNDLVASGLQMSLVGRTEVRGTSHGLSVTILEMPLSMGSMPRSHANGVTVQEASGENRMFIPAPMGTLMGTLMG